MSRGEGRVKLDGLSKEARRIDAVATVAVFRSFVPKSEILARIWTSERSRLANLPHVAPRTCPFPPRAISTCFYFANNHARRLLLRLLLEN